MNMFGHKWDEGIAASISASVTPQRTTVEANGTPGKCTSIQPSSALSTPCLMLVMPSPTGCMHAADASHQALVLTRLMRHLSWPACMRLQDKWSMHAPNMHGQVVERLLLAWRRQTVPASRRMLPADGCCDDALACLLARGCGRVEHWLQCLLVSWTCCSCRQARQ